MSIEILVWGLLPPEGGEGKCLFCDKIIIRCLKEAAMYLTFQIYLLRKDFSKKLKKMYVLPLFDPKKEHTSPPFDPTF